MSPPLGRLKEDSLPHGGTARSAKGASILEPLGRLKASDVPLGGTARSARGRP